MTTVNFAQSMSARFLTKTGEWYTGRDVLNTCRLAHETGKVTETPRDAVHAAELLENAGIVEWQEIHENTPQMSICRDCD